MLRVRDREGKRVAKGSGRLGESHAMLGLIRPSFCWIPVEMEQSVALTAWGTGPGVPIYAS